MYCAGVSTVIMEIEMYREICKARGDFDLNNHHCESDLFNGDLDDAELRLRQVLRSTFIVNGIS